MAHVANIVSTATQQDEQEAAMISALSVGPL